MEFSTKLDQHRLTEYLKRKMPHARDHRVDGLKRISGGSSRETYAFDLEWSEGGETRTRPMIGRRDPTGGLLKSDREREFKVIAAMHRAGLKVPEPLFLELDAERDGSPVLHNASRGGPNRHGRVSGGGSRVHARQGRR